MTLRSLGFLLLGSSGALAQGSVWGTQYRTVIVNTKASGAGVSGDVASFPLLVRLDSANAADLLQQATPGGGDLRVTDAEGANPLPFEIEYWNAARKQAAVWVLLPLVKGNDSVEALRLYWGRDGAVSNSNPAGVFDTANGFQAVFHFSETSDSAFDATANGFRAAPFNAPPDTIGAMGRSRSFNGIDQRFSVINSAAGPLSFQLTDSFTISAWVRPRIVNPASGTGHAIASKSDNHYLLGIYNSRWHVVTRTGSWFECRPDDDVPDPASALGGWHHFVVVQRGAPVNGSLQFLLYYDGALVGSCSQVYTSSTLRNAGRDLVIGAQPSAPPNPSVTFSRFWDGQLDEIRMENRERSAHWIKLSHATQKPGTSTVVLAATYPPSGVRPGIHEAAKLNVRAVPGGFVFTLPESARLFLLDGKGRELWAAEARAGERLTWKPSDRTPGLYMLRVNPTNPGSSPPVTRRLLLLEP